MAWIARRVEQDRVKILGNGTKVLKLVGDLVGCAAAIESVDVVKPSLNDMAVASFSWVDWHLTRGIAERFEAGRGALRLDFNLVAYRRRAAPHCSALIVHESLSQSSRHPSKSRQSRRLLEFLLDVIPGLSKYRS